MHGCFGIVNQTRCVLHWFYTNIDFADDQRVHGEDVFPLLEVRSHPLPLAPPPRMPVATPDHDFIRCVVQLVDKTSCFNASFSEIGTYTNIYIYIYIYSGLCMCLVKLELIKK